MSRYVGGIRFGKGLSDTDRYRLKRERGLCVNGKCEIPALTRTLCDVHYEIKLKRQTTTRQGNREYHNNQAKKYKKPYREEREKRRMANWYSRIKSNFGWNKERVDATLAAQDNLCAICRQPNNLDFNFGLDHDHKTNIPREFLCQRCNSTIGFVDDSIPLLVAMIQYLEKHSRVEIR